ncbi:hypothetical protein ACLB2K_075414 [Fragaria x ananassa]
MASRVHLVPLVLSLLWLIASPPLVSCHLRPLDTFSYHGGLLLTGKLDISILFYGPIGRTQKRVVRSFIKSLNHGGGTPKPRVTSWWDTVESYQSISSPDHSAPKIAVKVVSQITDRSCSLGKVITIDFIKWMVKTATSGKPPAGLVVIFAATALQACITLKPPNGNPVVDAILVNFAAGLAAAVTNPFMTGFSKPGPKSWPLEASTMCEGMFARGTSPGNPGKVALDGKSGGAFNAYGLNGMKFLLPALWNPRTCVMLDPDVASSIIFYV